MDFWTKLKMFPIYLRKKKIKRMTSKVFKKEKVSFGSLNPDKTFYVVRRQPPASGFYSNFLLILEHILEAKEKGYIPVVDYETFYSSYQEKCKINGSYNVWEYYFEQVSPYTLNEVYKSKNVILSATIPDNLCRVESMYKECEVVALMHDVYRSLKYKNCVFEFLENKYKEIIPENKKILGVLVRGTDYNKDTAPKHPKQPEIEEYADLMEKTFQDLGYDYIYVATEDLNKLNYLQNRFKDKLLFVKKDRIQNYRGGYLQDYVLEKSGAKYMYNLEYQAEIYILSKCHALIATATNGAVAAIYMNGNKFEYICMYSNGVY